MYKRIGIKEDISKIEPNDKGDYKITIDGVFFYDGGVKKSNIKDNSNERYVGKLVDYKGDEINCIIWANNWHLSKIYDYEDKFIASIKGYKTVYNDIPQVTIQFIEPIPPSDEEYNELIKVYTEYKQVLSIAEKESFVSELLGLIQQVNNRYYRKLLVDMFDDDMIAKFKEWTAAWERHHAFPGGLLVHTVNVAKKCYAYASVSSGVDKDLLITSALLHDIAKVKEYDGFPSKRRLYKGRLLYHPYMGAEMVSLKINEYRTSGKDEHLEYSDFPENLEVQLKHCILAHHGKPEYGAAVKPLVLEAHILHLMDDADAIEQYYKENVIDKEFDSNLPADKVRGYYDSFTGEYAYPTMMIQPYVEREYNFEIENTYPFSDEEQDYLCGGNTNGYNGFQFE